MLMFTIAIPYLTTSNLPWFMDLKFQVPRQYCSLQHQTLLSPPVTSTVGSGFYFVSASSFFLELLLHSSPVAYWAPTDLGSSSFSVIYFCLFILFTGFSRQEYWSCLQLPSPVDHVLSELSTVYAAAATAAKSLQLCLTLCDPIDGSLPGSSVPGILQARILEWVAISFSNEWKWKEKVKSLSHARLSVTPWTAAHQAPPSMGFSRQDCWSGVPLPVHIYV